MTNTLLATMAAGVLLPATALLAQQAQPSREDMMRVANQVRKRIVSISTYGVFDYISFGMEPAPKGFKVILRGYASRPTLKDSAERVLKGLEELDSVDNQIEVLPLSPNDEKIRTQAYLKIYGNPSLSRYNPNRGAPIYGGAYGARRAAGIGISNDPPPGIHPISIIVKNGNIVLEGVVDNDGDKNMANMMANQVSGAFSVTNNLEVLQPSKKKDKEKK
jgi:hypothetical protein